MFDYCRNFSTAVPTKFALKIVQRNVLYNIYIVFPQSDDVDLQSRSQLHLKVDKAVQSVFWYLTFDNISADIQAVFKFFSG